MEEPMSSEMANDAITHAFDEVKNNPAEAGVYAQIAVAQALLAIADELKTNTEALNRRAS
jgi:hypothetical protein